MAALEERIANLEGGRGGTCCASGHAAQMMLFTALMEPGDRFVASQRLYGGSITQFGKTFKKFDWHVDFVDTNDPDAVAAAIGERTRAIFVESLANPEGTVSDLERLARLAADAGIPLVVDNTLATPYLCRPIEWGADLVVHSTTKFLSGNGTSLGGCVVDSGRFDWGAVPGRYRSLAEPEPAYHGITFWESFGDLAFTMWAHAVGLRDLGAAMAPMNAFQTLLGVETLPLRMQRQCENARALALHLAEHPQVQRVSYPGVDATAPVQTELAARYLPIGAGAVFTFELRGGYDACVRAVERCNLFSHLANVGDTRSLILHPASTTHRQLSEEQQRAAGAGPETVRLSVGIETLEDLVADLDQALHGAEGVGG